MKKFWLAGIVLISALFIACTGQFETTLSLAEDEEISGSFESYSYYLHVTKIDKKNSFCYLDTYLSSASVPDVEQIVLDKETPVKISGFTASLVGIRESFTGDKCLIKVSNKRETTKITGAAARAPPPKPRATATPAQPATSARASTPAPATRTANATASRATPATPSSRASPTATVTPSRTTIPSVSNASSRAATPAQPVTTTRGATPATPAKPATGARAGAPTTTPTQPTTARAGTPTTAPAPVPSAATTRGATPITPSQPAAQTPPLTGARAGVPSTATTQPAAGRATTLPAPVTAGRAGTPTTIPQSGTATRAGTPTQPVTAVPRTAAVANATSPAPRTTSAQTALLVSECADKIDNDNDGLVDWPNDPDCTDRKGASEGVKLEAAAPALPQCSDGIDNDGDGLIDYDQELVGCDSLEDNDETDVTPKGNVSGTAKEVGALPQCSDGIDNDGDSLIDYDQELVGCETPEDDDETDSGGEATEETEEETAPLALQCADGIDNDGDGKIDGWDPGCSGEADSSEVDYVPEEPSGGGGTAATPSAPASEALPVPEETPLEELPPEEAPEAEEKPAVQETVAETTAAGKAEKVIERLAKGETLVVDTSQAISEVKSVELTARKDVSQAAFKIERTEKTSVPPPAEKKVVSTFHIQGPESDKMIEVKVEKEKYTEKTTANCYDTKRNKWRPGKVKDKKSDEKYVYLKVALPCRN